MNEAADLRIARLGYAMALEKAGRSEEAVDHWRELIRLNPSDNQGVRDLFIPALLNLSGDDEARSVLEEYADCPSASLAYAHALLEFRRACLACRPAPRAEEGGGEKAEQATQAAHLRPPAEPASQTSRLMAESTAEVLGMRVDKIRRRIVKELVIGAATVPIAGASLLACSRGGEKESGDKVFLPGPPPSPRSAPSKPIVYRARREGILPEGALFGDRAKIADGLGAAIAGAAEEADPIAGFRRLFRPNDVVGIKINALAGRTMSARPEVVSQVTRWLQDAGVPARNIVVFERDERELVRAGFPLNDSGDGVRVIGTNGDFDRKRRDWGPNSSRFSRILVDDITALINVGVLKDAEAAGVAIGMKDWYGVIHNPQRCHDDGCHPYIAHLAAFPLISDKLRVTIVDALTAQCHAGPMYSPRWTWPYGGFLVSMDPVALDTVGMHVIEDRRKEIGLPSLAEERRAPKWIAEAARIGLGEADLGRIKIADV